MREAVFSEEDVARFVKEGAIALRSAFSREIAEECRRLLWVATGCDEHDPSTWTRPVVRIEGRADAPFVAAANTERLHSAFDQLAGVGRWRRMHGLGTFPIRFPAAEEPGDDGWHVESTGSDAGGNAVVDPASRERVLLVLFLFSDVGKFDAPTRVRVGSHLEAARLLTRSGKPIDFFQAARDLVPLTAHCPEIIATGKAGDVWLCHPFLVHAAQRHRGSRVKFMAQPPLPGTGPVDPCRSPDRRSAVEEAVYQAVSDLLGC